MAYIDKQVVNGYNEYINAAVDDMGTQMDVGLLVLDAGQSYTFELPDKEIAIDLLEGEVTFAYAGKTVEASRKDVFHEEAYCLLAPRATKIEITAKSHAELYVQDTLNEKDYEPVMYTPETVQTQHAGSNNELMGCMKREIKTFFDLDNRDLQVPPERADGHHQRLPFPDGSSGLRDVLYVGHPSPGRRSLEQDPDR